MMKLATVALIAGLTAGCAGGSVIPRVEVDTLAGCRAYTSTLEALAELRFADALSDEQIATVDRWREQLNPVCQDDDPPRTTDVAALITQGLTALLLIERESTE